MIFIEQNVPAAAEPAEALRVGVESGCCTEGESMPRPLIRDNAPPGTFIPGALQRRYVVARQQDAWFINFDAREFGPYRSEREAMLFAIDAAHKLGEQGAATQVLRVDENGDAGTAWTYGRDPYPPRS